jgi:hypothetical protein
MISVVYWSWVRFGYFDKVNARQDMSSVLGEQAGTIPSRTAASEEAEPSCHVVDLTRPLRKEISAADIRLEARDYGGVVHIVSGEKQYLLRPVETIDAEEINVSELVRTVRLLEVDNAACIRCRGRGEIIEATDIHPGPHAPPIKVCPDCNGTGKKTG